LEPMAMALAPLPCAFEPMASALVPVAWAEDRCCWPCSSWVSLR
jgi:hypothetical protein